MASFECKQCHKQFEANRFWALYCSGACRVKAHYYRQKDEKKAQKQADNTSNQGSD